MIKKETYVNADGEVVYSRTVQFKGRFTDDKGYTLYAYGKTVSGRDIPFPADMSPTEIGYIAILSRHLLVNTNVIGKKDKKNKAYTLEEIGNVIGVKSPYRFIKRMIEMNMVVKVKQRVTHYILNPLYFLNGKYISDELYWAFQESLDKHLSKWIRDTYVTRREDGGSI